MLNGRFQIEYSEIKTHLSNKIYITLHASKVKFPLSIIFESKSIR